MFNKVTRLYELRKQIAELTKEADKLKITVREHLKTVDSFVVKTADGMKICSIVSTVTPEIGYKKLAAILAPAELARVVTVSNTKLRALYDEDTDELEMVIDKCTIGTKVVDSIKFADLKVE